MALSTTYTDAYLVDAVVGAPGEVHTEAKNDLMTVAHDQFGNEYVYMKGVVGTVEGTSVTYDEAAVTTVLVANAKGPVAFATGATVASTYGWYARKGDTLLAQVAANSADNAFLGRETSDGVIGDGRAAGDEIYGVISRQATTTAALAKVQAFAYMFVDDTKGS